MGLLSRFGAGLVKAAPIMGQMAQSSLLEEQKAADRTYLEQAETTKHNRLLGREKTARQEARELLRIRGEQASAAAQSGALQKYFSDSKAQLFTLLGVQENEMGEFNKQLENPLVTGERAKEINRLKDALAGRMADTYESIQKYDRLQREYVDPEGTILPGAPLVTEDYLRAISVGAANEVMDTYGIDSTGRTSLVHSPLIRDQIDTLNSAIGSEFGLEPLTKKQEDLFTEEVNTLIKDAERRGETRGWDRPERPSETISVEDPDEVVVPGQEVVADEIDYTDPWRKDTDIGDTLGARAIRAAFKWFIEGLREGIATKEPLPFFTQTQDPTIQKEVSKLSPEGRLFWNTFGDAIEAQGLEAAINSLAEQFESLSNADKEIMYGLNSGLAPNESSSRRASTPEVEDAISMLFNPKSMS